MVVKKRWLMVVGYCWLVLLWSNALKAKLTTGNTSGGIIGGIKPLKALFLFG